VRTYKLSATPSVNSLVLFIAYLSRRLRSIDKVLSALAFHFKPLMSTWEKVRTHPRVLLALRGSLKLTAVPIKRSPPLLPSHLVSFATSTLASPSPSHDDILALAIAVIGFGALLRLGEMVEPSHLDDRDPRKYIKRTSAHLVELKEFHFHLPYHKADRSWRGSDVVIVAENSPPAFNLLGVVALYLRSRDRLHPSNPYLFIRADGSLPPRSWFVDRLRLHAPLVSGHGLRAGGATYLASIGTSASFIK
ncbi:hypothetical protein BCR35DRAFT_258712, partial [Leucosporidium creatinivorum]